MIVSSRRSFLGGLLSALASPAIVRAANSMPVRALPAAETLDAYLYQQISFGFAITREAIADNLCYGHNRSLQEAMGEFKEIIAANIFNAYHEVAYV